MLKTFIYTCVALLVSTAAFADDFAAPSYRGNPLSAEVEWEFSEWDGLTTISPDYANYVDDGNPSTFLYDMFTTHIDLDSSSNWTWVEADGDGGLQASVNASFACNITNWVDEMPEKLLRIQITYIGESTPIITDVDGYSNASYHNPNPTHEASFLSHVDIDLNHYYEDYSIVPNPDLEQIIITVPAGTIIDQVYFDSVSAPEPATLALLAVGGIGLLRRYRK